MFTLFFLISWIGFATGMSFVLGGWWIILWIVLGYLVGYLSICVGLFLHTYLWIWLPPNNWFKSYGWRSSAFAITRFMFNLRIKTIGREKVPMKDKLVVYCNHKSNLDPVIVLQEIRRPAAFTPKSSLLEIPFFKDLLIGMGSMPVYRGDDRKTAKALIETIKNIENGFTMIVFPEGGKKNRDTDAVVATRAGAFKIAVKPKATILPVTINGNSQIQHRSPWLPTKITIVIHDPIPFEDYKHLTTAEIGDKVAGIINSGIINDNEKE